MKRINGLYTILAATLLLAGCTDKLEQNLQYTKIVPGEEIPFGATAHFENAEKGPKKSASTSNRTIYGDINKTGSLIEVNWVPGKDHVEIISPQAGGAPVAEFKVAGSENTDGEYGVDGTFNGTNRVDSLERIGDAGLQWSTSNFYEFYAMYPSIGQLKEVVPEVASGSYGLQKEVGSDGVVKGVMTGYLPVTQTPDISGSTSNDNGYVIAPDMNYAYMVAKEYYEVPEDKNYEANKIQMNFESLVTALEFDLVANHIGKQNDNSQVIKVTSVMLTSGSRDIAGNFKYTFPAGTDESIANGVFESSNDGSANYRSITMKLSDEGFALSEGMKLNVTFFVLPTVGVKNQTFDDLSLTVFYKVADQPQIKTATIKKAVVTRKYTRFTNVKLPEIEANFSGSTWFSALDDDVLVSQVSIPMAANAFANGKYGITDQYRQQQNAEIETMWNLGVRGFEMVNQCNGSSTTSNLGKMVASEKEYTGGKDFLEYLKILRKRQVMTFEYKDGEFLSGEPLVLLCTYQAVDDGYKPEVYIQQLFNSLNGLIGTSHDGTDLKVTAETFIQLTASTTVSDIMGKIAVIIRPGDDERWAYLNPFNGAYSGKTLSTSDRSPYGLTKSLPTIAATDSTSSTGSKWWGKVLMISDWGMDSWDSWHRRFGKEGYYYYATTATNAVLMVNDPRNNKKGPGSDYLISEKKYEDVILGDSVVPNTLKSEYYYEHDFSNKANAVAYVQDMTRVAKKDITKTLSHGIIRPDKYTINWKESLTEKKRAIDGLFELSVAEKNSPSNNLYINNLSSYYIVESGHDESWYPNYLKWRNGVLGAAASEAFPSAGKGGDYVNCSNDITKYVYGILSGSSNLSNSSDTNPSGTKLAEGPWGIVMMDFIANNDASKKLVNLIMMNNFSFPLAKENTNAYRTVKITDEKFNPELPLLDWK